MATVHHAPEHHGHEEGSTRRNWRTVWIVLMIVVAVAIVYSVASVVSQSGPSDTVIPADEPVTGGVKADGGIVERTPADQ